MIVDQCTDSKFNIRTKNPAKFYKILSKSGKLEIKE